MADAPGGIINDWQDKRILYARAEISLLFGKILLKCTLGQAFLAKLAYFVRFLLEKSCPRVHFANILPESSLLAAQGYKIRVFLPHIGRRIHSRLFNESQQSLSADNLICIRPLNRNGT